MKVTSYIDARHFRRFQQGKMPRKMYERERENKKESYRDMQKKEYWRDRNVESR